MNTKKLHTLLESNAQNFPDKLALVTESASLTWKDLHSLVNQMAQAILQISSHGSQQEVVAVLLPNTEKFVITYLALQKCGYICMPLDPTFKKIENERILEQLPPRLIISLEEFTDQLPALLPFLTYDDLLSRKSIENAPAFPSLDPNTQIASLLFTSGTTGKPKATPYTHSQHLWNIEAVTELWKWTSSDTIATSLPLSHWHGLVMAVAGMLYHANTLYLQERLNPEKTLALLSSGNVSLFMHVPIAYHALVHSELHEKYDISPVRLCISGSSYLPPSIWHSFHNLYGQKILERYGASETGLVASNTLEDRQPGSVGFPLEDVSVTVAESGELLLQSPGLFSGYYQNPEATAKNWENGRWHTSDIAKIDEKGRISLKGRFQEKIKRYGYTLYPRDIEWSLLQNPHISEAVVMGLQNSELSDEIIYFVVSNISVSEITEYTKKNLPHYWRADQIIVLPEIPKTRSGKPRLAELKSLLKRP